MPAVFFKGSVLVMVSLPKATLHLPPFSCFLLWAAVEHYGYLSPCPRTRPHKTLAPLVLI